MAMTAEQVHKVLQRVTQGDTLNRALLSEGIPPWDWYHGPHKDPIIVQDLARARQSGATALAEQTIEIADDKQIAPQQARNMIDARKWYAGTQNPRVFGPRIDLTVTPGADPAKLHAEGMARARLMRDQAQTLIPQVIDGATIYAAGTTDTDSVVDPFS